MFQSPEPCGRHGSGRQGGPRPCEGPIPNLEERWRYGSASPTHRRPSRSYTARAAARRRPGCCGSTATSVIFFFFNCRKGRDPDLCPPPPRSTPMEGLDPQKLRLQFISTGATVYICFASPLPHFVFSVRVRTTNKTFISLRDKENAPRFTENSLRVESLFSEILGARCFWNSEFFQFQKTGRGIFHKLPFTHSLVHGGTRIEYTSIFAAQYTYFPLSEVDNRDYK